MYSVFGSHEKGSLVKVIVYSGTETMTTFGIDEIETVSETIRQIAPTSNRIGELARLNKNVADGDEVEASAFTYIEDMEA